MKNKTKNKMTIGFLSAVVLASGLLVGCSLLSKVTKTTPAQELTINANTGEVIPPGIPVPPDVPVRKITIPATVEAAPQVAAVQGVLRGVLGPYGELAAQLVGLAAGIIVVVERRRLQQHLAQEHGIVTGSGPPKA